LCACVESVQRILLVKCTDGCVNMYVTDGEFNVDRSCSNVKDSLKI
jgi:hypothetical protein